MRIARPRLFSKLVAILATIGCVGFVVGCAPIRGYPDDPENTDQTLASLAPYFNGGGAEQQYTHCSDPVQCTAKRNEIVLARMRAYDIEFADFE
ncbi:MAG: hypothetical protein JO258_17465, partial [Alphaproteobacteria bacterium]|nr:hypothetical protein [Alphaproteobacteria bacterium]